jgi:NTE family protein
MAAAMDVPREADAVFEGGGVKGIAFAGAIKAAEDAGIEEWKNVAGTSAGAIVACLLVAGYRSDDLRQILDDADYRKFTDYGFGGRARGFVNQFWQRGLAPGRYFSGWLAEHLAGSPLAKSRNTRELRFGDVVRTDLPENLTEEQKRRARYRLRVIGSDISSGRMLVLPDAIEGFRRGKEGPAYALDDLLLVEAARMSMSYPYLYTPVTLWAEDGRPHFVVDGGLLSNFPVWLFDSGSDRPPARPTWGFRLHGGTALEEGLSYSPVTMPIWRIKLAKAMFQAATQAWDREQLGRATAVRTVSIPTGAIGTTQFDLSDEDARFLYESGMRRTADFFRSDETRAYLERFAVRGAPAPPPAATPG